jgi:hypothetical protein
MAIELLELHYHLRDNSHAMSAVVRNRCEAEALAVCLQIASELGIPIQLESSAFTEGGLKEIWQFIGQNNGTLSFLLAVIVLIFSRIPISDSEMDSLNKEVAKVTIEEKKLNIEKLKRELNEGTPKQETIAAAARTLEHDLKVVTRRSNFYRGLLDYNKVTAVGFTPVPDPSTKPTEEHTVQRQDFAKFVLPSDKLPVEVVEDARIEIVAPVLKEGTYLWKGTYDGQPISFSMLDQEFKTSVVRREVSFVNGSTIDCVLNVHRKFDEVGDITITGYSVATVLAKSDGATSEETTQGKRHRLSRRLSAGQGHLFDKSP